MADDSETVQALKSRPEEGARLLVRSYGRRLYAVARQLSRNNTDAEDLVARTLSRVVRGIGSFEGRSNFFSWQCSILANFFKMDRRRKGANALVFPEELPDSPDSSATPAEATERADAARELRAAVAELPEKLRTAVVLFYFSDMSVPDIAKAAGEPEGTIYYRIHEAKKAIREKIEKRQRMR